MFSILLLINLAPWWVSVTLLLSLSYLIIILLYLKYWRQMATWQPPESHLAKTSISVIIPARNEEQFIAQCLQSVLSQNYPSDLYEVIVVDDHSTDRTASIVNNLKNDRLRLVNLADYLNEETLAFKKKAIETGINLAKGELIVTTDADCEVLPDWLKYIAAFHESRSVDFIAAPVNFHRETNHLERFQSLDLMGMMLITGAGIQGRFMHMCNGANMAYSKDIFREVGGFEGIDHLASGDDLLLMQKIAARFPEKVGFLKHSEAIVHCRAQKTWSSFFEQRLRWATKSNQYAEWQITFILALVFFFCGNILLALLLSPVVGALAFWIFIGQLLFKSAIDYFFLKEAGRFFEREDLMQYFLPAQAFHILYIVSVGIMANLTKSYYWKGRKVR